MGAYLTGSLLQATPADWATLGLVHLFVCGLLWICETQRNQLLRQTAQYKAENNVHSNLLKKSGASILHLTEDLTVRWASQRHILFSDEPVLGRQLLDLFPTEFELQAKEFVSNLTAHRRAEEVMFSRDKYQVKVSGMKRKSGYQVNIISLEHLMRQNTLKHRVYDRMMTASEDALQTQSPDEQNRYLLDVISMVTLEQVLAGSVEMCLQKFSLKEQLCRVIDCMWSLARERELEIVLYRASKLVDLVEMDLEHLLCMFRGLLKLTFQTADRHSHVKIHFYPRFMGQSSFALTLVFQSAEMGSDLLESFLSYSQTSARSLQNIENLTEQYGLEIALLPYLLEVLDVQIKQVTKTPNFGQLKLKLIIPYSWATEPSEETSPLPSPLPSPITQNFVDSLHEVKRWTFRLRSECSPGTSDLSLLEERVHDIQGSIETHQYDPVFASLKRPMTAVIVGPVVMTEFMSTLQEQLTGEVLQFQSGYDMLECLEVTTISVLLVDVHSDLSFLQTVSRKLGTTPQIRIAGLCDSTESVECSPFMDRTCKLYTVPIQDIQSIVKFLEPI